MRAEGSSCSVRYKLVCATVIITFQQWNFARTTATVYAEMTIQYPSNYHQKDATFIRSCRSNEAHIDPPNCEERSFLLVTYYLGTEIFRLPNSPLYRKPTAIHGWSEQGGRFVCYLEATLVLLLRLVDNTGITKLLPVKSLWILRSFMLTLPMLTLVH